MVPLSGIVRRKLNIYCKAFSCTRLEFTKWLTIILSLHTNQRLLTPVWQVRTQLLVQWYTLRFVFHSTE